MTRHVVAGLLFLTIVLAPVVGAWEFDPLASSTQANHLDGTLALLRRAWGDLSRHEGEIIAFGPSSISILTCEGRQEDFRILPEAAVYLNGYSSSVPALGSQGDLMFCVRCFTDKHERVVLLDASYHGFECVWVGKCDGRVTVQSSNGAVLTREAWPAAIGGPWVFGNRVYVLLDFDGRIRRVFGE